MNDLPRNQLLAKIDMQRILLGFMPVSEMVDVLTEQNNVILDPFSILISKGVEIGSGNIFYPNVILEAANGGSLSIGDNNLFYSGSKLLADHGQIVIGDGNEFGDGGIRIKANIADTLIEIGSRGRYMSGAEIIGRCSLGSGTQILGAISVQNCTLKAGDSYKDPDAATRGGLLKGFGTARNLTVQQGEVINGQGTFEQSKVEQQTVYHPKNA